VGGALARSKTGEMYHVGVSTLFFPYHRRRILLKGIRGV